MPNLKPQTPLFSGNSSTTLDDKLRVTIPARWRSSSDGGEEFFLTVDNSGSFIRVMPPAVFASAIERLTGNPTVTRKEIAQFERMFYARSRQVATDKAGRLMIPADYAASAGIKKDVVLVGTRENFEIYSPKAWERAQKAEAETYSRLSDLAGL